MLRCPSQAPPSPTSISLNAIKHQRELSGMMAYTPFPLMRFTESSLLFLTLCCFAKLAWLQLGCLVSREVVSLSNSRAEFTEIWGRGKKKRNKKALQPEQQQGRSHDEHINVRRSGSEGKKGCGDRRDEESWHVFVCMGGLHEGDQHSHQRCQNLTERPLSLSRSPVLTSLLMDAALSTGLVTR